LITGMYRIDVRAVTTKNPPLSLITCTDWIDCRPTDRLWFTHALLDRQWRRNRGFRRFNEPGPPSSWGPRVVGPQKIFRQDSWENH